jgi:hypothetical protein
LDFRTAPSAPENSAPNKPLKFRLDKLAQDHPSLAERGLTRETIIDFGIGFCGKGMMADRIAIPIHNTEGEVVAYAGRWPGEAPEGTPKYKLPQGFRKSLELFNIDRAIKLGLRKVIALMRSTMTSPFPHFCCRLFIRRIILTEFLTSKIHIASDQQQSNIASTPTVTGTNALCIAGFACQGRCRGQTM